MRALRWLLFVVIANAALAESPHAGVYDAVLRDVSKAHLVFEETAILFEKDLGLQKNDIPAALVERLLDINLKPIPLGDYVPPAPHKCVTAADLGDILKHYAGAPRPRYYDYERMHAAFPDFEGSLELTIPAYSASGDEALVYFWTGCGNLCAEGWVYWLRKVDGKWQVQKRFMPWIS